LVYWQSSKPEASVLAANKGGAENLPLNICPKILLVVGYESE